MEKSKPLLILLYSVSTLYLVKKLFEDSSMNGVEIKDNPRTGGWNHKQIKEYNKSHKANLKHGVDYDPKTLLDFKRKGSWATRHYKRKNTKNGLNNAPLKNSKGELLPFSTQAIVWGEKPPTNRREQKRLVRLGEKLLETYRKFKEEGYAESKKLPKSILKKFKKGL